MRRELDALSRIGGKAELEYRVRFAHSRILGPQTEPSPTTVNIRPGHQRIFRIAADLLRSRRPQDDVTITGTIVALSRDTAFGPGEVVIRGVEVGASVAHRYRVELSADQYTEALDAHAANLWVSARGALDLHGNYLMLQTLIWFVVQQQLPAE